MSRAWYGMENGMKEKFWYGIWKMPEWNERLSSILDFVHGIYRKIHLFSDNLKYEEVFSKSTATK